MEYSLHPAEPYGPFVMQLGDLPVFVAFGLFLPRHPQNRYFSTLEEARQVALAAFEATRKYQYVWDAISKLQQPV